MRQRMLSCLLVLGLGAVACGDDDGPGGGGPIDAGADPIDAAIDASCFENPQTHAEILNACVDWQFVEKTPVTPLRNEDGTLPDLPQ